MPHSTISRYNHRARQYQAQYDSVPASQVHADWSAVLADLKPGRALDVGAGSGRDAQWLTQKGWYVTAVEQDRHFIARASGNSMNGGKNPVFDGDYLLLEQVSPNNAGSISDQTMVIEHQDETGNTESP
jgi:SAM-dependent methyltransferase